MNWLDFAYFRLFQQYSGSKYLDHACNKRCEESSNRTPVHQQALNFENNARSAQKSVLGAKWGLRAVLSSRLSSCHMWQGFCSFSRYLKNLDSEPENRFAPKSLRSEIWRNVWILDSFGMEKTDLFWKKSFSTFLEDFQCRVAYSAISRILGFRLYFGLMEVLQILALKVPKIANFLFFEKTNLNLHHISKWAKKLIPSQI